jgi:hypothetical protein
LILLDTPLEVTLTEAHPTVDSDDTTVTVAGYEDVASMAVLERPDGDTRSIGKRLVNSVTGRDDRYALLHRFTGTTAPHRAVGPVMTTAVGMSVLATRLSRSGGRRRVVNLVVTDP